MSASRILIVGSSLLLAGAAFAQQPQPQQEVTPVAPPTATAPQQGRCVTAAKRHDHTVERGFAAAASKECASETAKASNKLPSHNHSRFHKLM
jgi:hypothetical protein